MKKLLQSFIILCCLLLSTPGFSQQKCTAKTHNLMLIAQEQNICISCFSENVATRPMFCLNFQNKGTTAVKFSFIVKDKNGEVISTESLSLAPGQSVNGFDNVSYNQSMVIPLADGQSSSDFTVELTF